MEGLSVLYLLIKNETLLSVCNYEPNIDSDDIRIVKYSGKIPFDRIIYIDGKIRDKDNYIDINGKYILKTKTLETQLNNNQTSRQYLKNSDWLVIRHRDQLALGIKTTLSDEEYLNILKKRQLERERVVNYGE